MKQQIIGTIICLGFATMAAAQNPVNTTGGSTNSIPLFTGNVTIGNSAITQLNGNIGIGTPNPQAALHVDSTSNNNLILSGSNPTVIFRTNYSDSTDGSISGSYLQGDMSFNSPRDVGAPGYGFKFNSQSGLTRLFVDSTSGKVGIGTTNPGAQLDVGDTRGAGALETVFGRLSEGNLEGDGTYLGARSWSTQPSNALAFSLEHHFYGQINSSIKFYRGSGSTGGFLSFSTNNNDERMRIDTAGNVGIGTPSPLRKLHISGDVQIDGNLYFGSSSQAQSEAYAGVKCGGDYAESVDVTGDRRKYEPGDVLVIDPSNPGKFLKSAEPYSTSVMGIYSTKPGVLGRRQTTEKSPDEIPMAMVGIVPTKVSAENGPIRPGDLLVSSSTPGYAMKGTDRGRMLGAIVGKALGSLAAETGVIEVGVTLQ